MRAVPTEYIDFNHPAHQEPPDLGTHGFLASNYLCVGVQDTFFPNALGVAANSSLEYPIPDGGGFFYARVGLPDTAPKDLRVNFWVLADDNPCACALNVESGKPQALCGSLLSGSTLTLRTESTVKGVREARGLWLTPHFSPILLEQIRTPIAGAWAVPVSTGKECAVATFIENGREALLAGWLEAVKGLPEEIVRLVILDTRMEALKAADNMVQAADATPIFLTAAPKTFLGFTPLSLARLADCDRFLYTDPAARVPADFATVADPLRYFKKRSTLLGIPLQAGSRAVDPRLLIADRKTLLRLEWAVGQGMPDRVYLLKKPAQAGAIFAQSITQADVGVSMIDTPDIDWAEE